MNLSFHLSLSTQPSFSQIIVYLYNPNFSSFEIFINPADDRPLFTSVSWPSWILKCQQRALFLDPFTLPFTCQLSHLNVVLPHGEFGMSSLLLKMASHLPQSWNQALTFTVASDRITCWPWGTTVTRTDMLLCDSTMTIPQSPDFISCYINFLYYRMLGLERTDYNATFPTSKWRN